VPVLALAGSTVAGAGPFTTGRGRNGSRLRCSCRLRGNVGRRWRRSTQPLDETSVATAGQW